MTTQVRETFTILIYPRKREKSQSGYVPLYLRITVDSSRSEFSLKRKIDPEKWLSAGGRVQGSDPATRQLNQYLDELRTRIYEIHGKLVLKGKPFTAESIKNKLLHADKKYKGVLEIYDHHNKQLEQVLGRDFSYGAYRRHVRTRDHLEAFMKDEYDTNDLPVREVKLRFITGFEFFLKAKKVGNQNTVTKYIVNLKKLIRIAFANNWINKDPFIYWKASWKPVDRECLTQKELRVLMEKKFPVARLEQVKDTFLFCCFTGLAYVDVQKLSKEHIVLGMDGDRWIKVKRSKTSTLSSIPLLPTAEKILEKYKNHTSDPDNYLLLPIISNQKMNAYLKEIADVCEIKKKLTFHIARHTFATTVTLSNGVPIESVSKMLGHTSLKTTQIYAKVIDKKLKEDMEVVRVKYDMKQEKEKRKPTKKNGDQLDFRF